jgi:hypothetical protein
MLCSFGDADDSDEPAVFPSPAEEIKADSYDETQLPIK